MRFVRSVQKSLAEFEAGDLDDAMLHALMAVDGAASRSNGRSTAKQFKAFLRKHLDVMQVMAGAVSMDLAGSRFPPLPPIPGVTSPPEPDVVDVIYAAHRCTLGHGVDVPLEFQMNTDNAFTVHVAPTPGVQFPPSMVPALLAAVVLHPQNRDVTGGGDAWLSWEHPGSGDYAARKETFAIRDWWGRKHDFLAVTDGPQSLFTVGADEWPMSVAHPDLPIVIEVFS